MTAEQLKELLGKVTQGEWYIDGGEVTSDSLHEMDCVVNCVYGPAENATLIALAPQLARRVITAENRISKLESLVAKTALYAECAFDDRPNRQGINGAIDWQDGYRDGTIAAASAIRNAAKATT